MDTKWLNDPSLQKMDPAKKQIMLEFIRETEGKPMDKAMKSIASTNAKMKALNLSFSQEESELITRILMSRMTPAQRSQAEMMKTMMNSRNSNPKK